MYAVGTLVVLVVMWVAWFYWLSDAMGGSRRGPTLPVSDVGVVDVSSVPSIHRWASVPVGGGGDGKDAVDAVDAVDVDSVVAVVEGVVGGLGGAGEVVTGPSSPERGVPADAGGTAQGEAVEEVVAVVIEYWPDGGAYWCQSYDEGLRQCLSGVTMFPDVHWTRFIGRGAACPPEWLGSQVVIAGRVFECVDTGSVFCIGCDYQVGVIGRGVVPWGVYSVRRS